MVVVGEVAIEKYWDKNNNHSMMMMMMELGDFFAHSSREEDRTFTATLKPSSGAPTHGRIS